MMEVLSLKWHIIYPREKNRRKSGKQTVESLKMSNRSGKEKPERVKRKRKIKDRHQNLDEAR